MGGSSVEYGVVVYGATTSGIAAVRQAARFTPRETAVLLLNPDWGWGGNAGAAGLNMWDTREWQTDGRAMTPQGGTFREWYRAVGKAFDPQAFAKLLREEVESLDNVDVLDGWDVTAVDRGGSDRTIDTIGVSSLRRSSGDTRTTDDPVEIRGQTFIDASRSGRLTRLADLPQRVGRADWGPDNRQMVATLLFELTDVAWETIKQARSRNGRSTYSTTTAENGNRIFWGGHWEAEHSAAVDAFSEEHPRFRLRALNAAEGRTDRFWVNGLLIYDVDGRYDARERRKLLSRGTHTPWDIDTAYRRATTIVENDAFLAALRSFPGLGRARLVRTNGEASVGRTLYVRETVHTLGPTGFAMTGDQVKHAGRGPDSGADAAHYEQRIGLGYYWMNSNGYANDSTDKQTFYPPKNPVYLPYDAIRSKTCPNLLVPGYAASVSSEAWFELRALPNLCVLGDAAGTAAALAAERDIRPGEFAPATLSVLRERLVTDCDAIVEKNLSYGVVA